MMKKMIVAATAGVLSLAVAVPVSYGQNYSAATNEALSKVSEGSQDVMVEMMEKENQAFLAGQEAYFQQLQEEANMKAGITGNPQSDQAGKSSGGVKYVYKQHKGEPALKGVELPKRLFNNVPGCSRKGLLLPPTKPSDYSAVPASNDTPVACRLF